MSCRGTDGREGSSYTILEMVEMEGIGSRYGINYRTWSEGRWGEREMQWNKPGFTLSWCSCPFWGMKNIGASGLKRRKGDAQTLNSRNTWDAERHSGRAQKVKAAPPSIQFIYLFLLSCKKDIFRASEPFYPVNLRCACTAAGDKIQTDALDTQWWCTLVCSTLDSSQAPQQICLGILPPLLLLPLTSSDPILCMSVTCYITHSLESK